MHYDCDDAEEAHLVGQRAHNEGVHYDCDDAEEAHLVGQRAHNEGGVLCSMIVMMLRRLTSLRNGHTMRVVCWAA